MKHAHSNHAHAHTTHDVPAVREPWPSLLAMSVGQRCCLILPLLLLLWLAVAWALGDAP